jgi:flavin-dependent dehydrogenase
MNPDFTGVSIRAYVRGATDVTDMMEIYPMNELLPACGWIFPVRDGLANVGVGAMLFHIRRRGMNLNHIFERFLRDTRYSRDKLASAEVLERPRGGLMRVGLPASRQLQGNVLLTGDAAGMTNPFSGEGISYALESGRWAAGAVRSALQSGNVEALQVYPQILNDLYGHYFKRGLQCIRYGTRPMFMDPLIFAASHSRRVCDKMSRYLLNVRQSEVPE